MEAKTIKKYNAKSTPDLIKLATKHFNEFIRKRDSTEGIFRCISCQQVKTTDKMHAGHYLSAGNNGAVRFDERNVHGQCSECNMHMHGNLLPYRTNLIRKLGEEEVEAIEIKSKMNGFRWDRFALIEIIETYKLKKKQWI
jgi:hypothetical protein